MRSGGVNIDRASEQGEERLTSLTTPGESFPAFGADAKAIAVEANLPNPIILGLSQDWMGCLMVES